MPGGIPHLLGNAMPSPGGKYSLMLSDSHGEVRRATDSAVHSLDRKDAVLYAVPTWSPNDKRLLVVFRKLGASGAYWEAGAYWIEALDPENGRWTTLVSPQREYISGVVWVSDRELIYTKYEPAPRTDSNLWVVDVDPSTGLPSGAAQRRTQWTDFRIQDLSATADGTRMCFIRYSGHSNVYVGDLQAHGTRLASLRRLTLEDAVNLPFAWTPDSKAVLLNSDRDGQFRIYKQEINKDAAELITSGPGSQTAPRISPDGLWLLYWDYPYPGYPKTRVMKMPLAGGAAQEILAGNDIAGLDCGHTAGGACVLLEIRGKVSIFSLLDPIKGRGPKVLQIVGEIRGGPVMSPNGRHIAFVVPGTPQNRIRMINLYGAIETEITVAGAQYLASLDWSADGTGFFSGDMQQTTTRLLHIERSGGSQVLWTQPGASNVWGVRTCGWSRTRDLLTRGQ
jgi:Tol biopolymer transport system component